MTSPAIVREQQAHAAAKASGRGRRQAPRPRNPAAAAGSAPLLDRLGDGAHEPRADDHAVRAGVRGGRRLVAVGDAEAERDGHRAVGLHAREQRRTGRSRPPPAHPSFRSREPCRQIHARLRPIAASRASGVVGATSGTSATPAPSQAASTAADSSSGRSGTIRPLIPRAAQLAGEALRPAREQRVRVTHEHDRDVLGDPRAGLEDGVHGWRRRPARCVAAAWITGPSASGSRERHAELDEVGAGRRRRRAPIAHRGLDVREARPSGRASAPRGRARRRTRRRSARRRSLTRRPSLSSASARSLSPRPDRQTRSTVSASPRAPAPSTQATACEDSSAGMIPSSRGERAGTPRAPRRR